MTDQLAANPSAQKRFIPSPRSGSVNVRVLAGLPETPDPAFVYLGLHDRGAVTGGRGGTTGPMEPGDLVLCDPGRWCPPLPPEAGRLTVFRIPRCFLDISDADLRRVMGIRVPGGEGVGALVSRFLSALAAEAELRRSRAGDRLTRSAADLLVVLVADLLGAETSARTTGASTELPERIRAFIEARLADPDLSPESIAAAHHISVRYLHKLFQDDGTTVSQWIRRRRLDSCREDLVRPANRGFTVSAVAHRWGFSSPSHFSRAFRDAYGMSPSAWRSAGGESAPEKRLLTESAGNVFS